MVQKLTLQDEFKKNPDLNKEDFNNLKEWYKKQPHLPEIPDELLVLIFHSCYFKMEAAKTTVDHYFTVRTHVPEFFTNRDPYTTDCTPDGNPVVRYFMLTKSNPEGHRCIYIQIANTDPAPYNLAAASKSFIMHSDVELNTNGTSPGFVILFNMDGVSFGHVKKMNLMVLKKILYYLQEAMPVRLKGLHFINVVPFMDIILNMMKPFMKKELLEMMHLHMEGIHTLYKFIPLDILPSDLGGNDKSIQELGEQQMKILKEHKKWFEEESKLRAVESKRPGKAKNAGEIFGLEGSFKKLDLD